MYFGNQDVSVILLLHDKRISLIFFHEIGIHLSIQVDIFDYSQAMKEIVQVDLLVNHLYLQRNILIDQMS